jgi:hypothetical protein
MLREPRRGATPLAIGASRWTADGSCGLKPPNGGDTLPDRLLATSPKSVAPIRGLRILPTTLPPARAGGKRSTAPLGAEISPQLTFPKLFWTRFGVRTW